MLRRSSETVADCQQRALEAGERADRAINPDDRNYWLARQQRWLEIAAHQERSERIDHFVSSLSSPAGSFNAPPEPDDALRLLVALNGITNPDDLAEVLALAERLARGTPGFAELMDRRQAKH